MTEPRLRNEETQAGKEIWEAVDKAASQAPDWVKGTVVKILKENIARSSKSGEVTVSKGVKPKSKQKTKGLKSPRRASRSTDDAR
jgi:hypothetical protein